MLRSEDDPVPSLGTESTANDHPLEIDPQDQQELHRIATAMFHTMSSQPKSPVIEQVSELASMSRPSSLTKEASTLDPHNAKFDLEKWLQYTIRRAGKLGFKPRKAGFTFKHLGVSGSSASLNIQQNVGSIFLLPLRLIRSFTSGGRATRPILKDFNGVVKSGEMLIVLGRPGSGCTTFLKTVAGELHGLTLDQDSVIHYNGISRAVMMKEFKGEVTYNQEVDKHFPHLTVGETLEFAAAARTPQNRLDNVPREQHARNMRDLIMTVFGLSHTVNTKVGSDFIRGVSGGERKRVSIAEMALSRCTIALWDNATRGLDAAMALEFAKALRTSANLLGVTHAVAVYQASQAIFDLFDKAIVLYDGRCIYFGSTSSARQYFENMGWHCPARQTTGDFLTSVTNPTERRARDGSQAKVPRTPEEFQQYWRSSPEYAALQEEILQHEQEFPIGGDAVSGFQQAHRAQQAKHVRPESKYLISIPMQIKLNVLRAYRRLKNNKSPVITTIIGRMVMALIVGSIYYGTPETTQSFVAKGSAIFYATLLNALMAISEINTLYEQRPIVEKQKSYAFYHPFTEALAGIISDLPVKLVSAIVFNVIFYFLAGLRYEAAAFFIYFAMVFLSMLAMSCIYRTLAASTKTITQAMGMAGVMTLAIVVYTGYTIPRTNMHPWFEWISWINPVSYAFEALLVNELHGRQFPCASLVPAYPNLTGETFVCAIPGARMGELTVSGDDFLQAAYEYSYSHLGRNFGIVIAFVLFFLAIYLVASELNSSTTSAAEMLVFRQGHIPKQILQAEKHCISSDEESALPVNEVTAEKEQSTSHAVLPIQKDIFTWRNVVYDISIKGEQRRLLDNISGFVKPGTLTALMGVSGAGKTTLLDVLAQRTSTGIITGEMLVNGRALDSSFQRKAGYVQQQDVHLETSTVREALQFSALLRQPATFSKIEKLAYVEDVLTMLDMENFAEAVVGVPGEGLNVEQRKLLTIGVELAARPALLLFLDEPTSGLDSQSSWAIVSFLRKLANHGQAILSTIHQPSSILFQEFDQLLFLAKGGKTVYFGDIGPGSRTLLDYFERNGSRHCGDDENPAEFMLSIIGAGASGSAVQDWAEVWKHSHECEHVQREIDRLCGESQQRADKEFVESDQTEFAMPFKDQLFHVTVRIFQQYWRTPQYIYGKLMLGLMASLFIGFSFFDSGSSLQGMQDVLFSIFMLMAIFPSLVQQIIPRFVIQRSLYELRERPSRTYTWQAFLISNVLAEIPYQIFLGCLVWACYYFAVFGIQSAERNGLMLLYCIEFFIFASSFGQLLISGLPDAQTAGTICTLMFSLCLTFNGVLLPPDALPGFWIFLYRVSPLTYLVSGIASTGLHARKVTCNTNEVNVFNPPKGVTCGKYMAAYLAEAPGQLLNPEATTLCKYCPLQNADQYLATRSISWSDRWRNFGLVWVYIVFNISAAFLLYYISRVRPLQKQRKSKSQKL